MANATKIRKHAPYRKSLLIPLWTCQLALSSFLFIISCMDLYTDNRDNDYYYNNSTRTAFDAIHMLLNLFLTLSVIFIIVKFSNFTLTTHVFKIQSIAAVVIGVVCTALYLGDGGGGWIMAAFPAGALVASIAICGRVCVLRRRVKRGHIGEMKRGRAVKVIDVEDNRGVELEDGNKFRVVDVDDGKMGAGVKVAVGAGGEIGKPRPSFNSVGMGISGAPEKVVREFV